MRLPKISIPLKQPFEHRHNAFLRATGLELLSLLGFGRKTHEVPKPVFQTSRRTALLRAGVHVLPILASTAMITINLQNIYVGRTLTGEIKDAAVNIAMLQVTAKIQELLLVASLTSIVVYRLRRELVTDGVPLGAIGGAFLFSSMSYFWSPEFWGSFNAKSSIWTKIRIYGLLVLCGLLAAIVGPASAVLLVPRQQAWNAGAADIYLRGSPEEIWPQHLESLPQEAEKYCNGPDATMYPICPSGGYNSIMSYSRSGLEIQNLLGLQSNISSFQYGQSMMKITSPLQLVPDVTLTGNFRAWACETSMIGVSVAETILEARLLHDWYQAVMSIPYNPLTTSLSEYKYFSDLFSSVKSTIPAVRVGCTVAQNISAAESIVEFPVMPETGCWRATDTLNFSSLATEFDHIRTTWTSLPPRFGAASSGLVLELPWVSDNSRAVLGCTIDARWTNGTIKSGNGEFFSAVFKTAFSGSIEDLATYKGHDEYSEFRPTTNDSWRKITFDKSWLDTLTPTLTTVSGVDATRNATTLDLIIENTALLTGLSKNGVTQTEAWNTPADLNRTVSLEWILASLVADGLSRTGSASVLNTTGPMHQWTLNDYNMASDFQDQLFSKGSPLIKPSFTPLRTNRVEITITGYSYQAGTITDYLAIAVLLIHALMAIIHTVNVIITRQSSGCWDSVTELLALALNSRRATTALPNTCAGIRELDTYGKIAVVRAIKPLGDNIPDNRLATAGTVEMLFEDNRDTEPQELQQLLRRSVAGSREPSQSIERKDVLNIIERPRADSGSTVAHSRFVSSDYNIKSEIVERIRADEVYGHSVIVSLRKRQRWDTV